MTWYKKYPKSKSLEINRGHRGFFSLRPLAFFARVSVNSELYFSSLFVDFQSVRNVFLWVRGPFVVDFDMVFRCFDPIFGLSHFPHIFSQHFL